LQRCCELIESAVEVGYAHLIDKRLYENSSRDFFKVLKWAIIGGLGAIAAFGLWKYLPK